jgi:hypothetical protein
MVLLLLLLQLSHRFELFLQLLLSLPLFLLLPALFVVLLLPSHPLRLLPLLLLLLL